MRALILIPLVLATGGAEAAARPKPKPKPVAVAPAAPVVPELKAAPQPRTESAPWWVDRPIIPQTGVVQEEIEANRASFSGSFLGTAKTVEQAQALAMKPVAPLTEALRKLGADKVRVTTSFFMRARYQQYKNKDGTKVEDQRGDKIEAYDATITLTVDVTELSVLERAYALVLAAGPSGSTPVSFSLQTDNATKARLFSAAVADARARAEVAAQINGLGLGPVRLIDSTGRACTANILGRATPVGAGRDDDDQVTQSSMMMKKKAASPPPPGMGPSLEARAAANAFIQSPPLIRVTTKACVIYDLK
ncbi:SIMPL domain-containing protein [Asticcacaulis sp. BYS171W]|uniref:SIMPL domain-containing protein n=1 Tax=Asticcacaulis aquaticus TaxID=2984212 RepID=A0ABT5HR73_9CAUL|nr:SIMPL domain-containing protein [Asticcacaulis aquaticus]MDC7682571.1 SIMPL domain-containing protein [Asticcacaulis aquaticus]